MGDDLIRHYERELQRSGIDTRDLALEMLRFYCLAWGDHDASAEFWFASSQMLTKDEFKALTASLVEEACKASVAREPKGWVGWREVVEAMVPLLEAKGFKALKPTSVTYSGGIIDSEHDLEGDDGVRAPESVVAHNLAFRDELYATRFGRPRAELLSGQDHGPPALGHGEALGHTDTAD